MTAPETTGVGDDATITRQQWKWSILRQSVPSRRSHRGGDLGAATLLLTEGVHLAMRWNRCRGGGGSRPSVVRAWMLPSSGLGIPRGADQWPLARPPRFHILQKAGPWWVTLWLS
jgi:hypothetical protein